MSQIAATLASRAAQARQQTEVTLVDGAVFVRRGADSPLHIARLRDDPPGTDGSVGMRKPSKVACCYRQITVGYETQAARSAPARMVCSECRHNAENKGLLR